MPGGGILLLGVSFYGGCRGPACRKRCTGEKLKEFVQLGDEKHEQKENAGPGAGSCDELVLRNGGAG